MPMTDPEIDRITEEIKRKYIPPPSVQLFHYGVIFLGSLVIGLIYFQFVSIPSDVKPEDVSLLRQGFGIWLGCFIAAGGVVPYFIWRLWCGHKAKQEVTAKIMAAALKRIEKKE
jgi:hypothetical protein